MGRFGGHMWNTVVGIDFVYHPFIDLKKLSFYRKITIFMGNIISDTIIIDIFF